MFGRKQKIHGKTVVVTGASSGIGRAACLQLAEKGAKVIALARREDELRSLEAEVQAAGGAISVYRVDLADFDQLDAVAETMLTAHPQIDVLVNNAGRSIRRKLEDSLERFHDFERCMQINYFAAVRLTLKLLPSMLAAKKGQVVNVITWGTLFPSPLFAAYTGSKSALEGFTKAMGAELSPKGIVATTIHYPVVYTPMIKPAAEHYKYYPGMTAEEAGEWIVRAIEKQPARIAPGFALLGGMQAYVFPKLSQQVVGRLSS